MRYGQGNFQQVKSLSGEISGRESLRRVSVQSVGELKPSSSLALQILV